MDEVDWLKSRLEHLETSIVSQSQGSRGEPQGRPVSRRGRSGKGGSASEPSDQVRLSVSSEGCTSSAHQRAAAECSILTSDLSLVLRKLPSKQHQVGLSMQAQAPALDDPGAGKGVMLETDSPSPNGETGAPVKQSAAPTNARKETEGALESDKIVSGEDAHATEGSRAFAPPKSEATTGKLVVEETGTAADSSSLKARAASGMARTESEQKSPMRLHAGPEHESRDTANVSGDGDADSQASSGNNNSDIGSSFE